VHGRLAHLKAFALTGQQKRGVGERGHFPNAIRTQVPSVRAVKILRALRLHGLCDLLSYFCSYDCEFQCFSKVRISSVALGKWKRVRKFLRIKGDIRLDTSAVGRGVHTERLTRSKSG
jgi:hypothetical protein